MSERLTLPTTPTSTTPVSTTPVEIKSTTGGSTSAPVLALVDSNTGLYSSQSGKIDFAVQGSNVMSMSSAGLLFNNATTSYTPSSLNYYEEWSGSISFSGAINSTSRTITIVRVGKQCTLKLPALLAAYLTTDFISSTVAIPQRFRPSATVTAFTPTSSNTSAAYIMQGYVKLFSNGLFTIYAGNLTTEVNMVFTSPSFNAPIGTAYDTIFSYLV